MDDHDEDYDDYDDDVPKSRWAQLKGTLSKAFHFAHSWLMPFAAITIGLALIGPAAAAPSLLGTSSVAFLDPFAAWAAMFVPDPAGLSYAGDYLASSWSNLITDGTLISENASTAFNAHSGAVHGAHGLAEMASHGADHAAHCAGEFGGWVDELSPDGFAYEKDMAATYSGGSMMEYFTESGLCSHPG